MIQEYEEQQQQLNEIYDDSSSKVCKAAQIVGITTTGLAGKQKLVRAIR